MRKIIRSGYVARRKGRRPTLIRNMGLVGKDPRIIPVRSTGTLTMFGYSPKISSPTMRRRVVQANSACVLASDPHERKVGPAHFYLSLL